MGKYGLLYRYNRSDRRKLGIGIIAVYLTSAVMLIAFLVIAMLLR